MFSIIIGDIGGGKTRKLAMLAKAYYDMGRRIVSNIHLSFPFIPFGGINFETEPELRETVLCLDEIHLCMDSRRSMSATNLDASYIFLQTRKVDVDVVGTTQYLDQLDLRARNLIDLLIHSRGTSFVPNPVPGGRALATEFEYAVARRDGLTWIPPREKLGDERHLYNTRQLLKPTSIAKRPKLEIPI